MICTALTNRAMQIAYEAHAGQVDKCGTPYVFHPYHLAEQMPDEITTCVALLHDVVEDTPITLDELEREFPPEVTEPLRLLTHDPAVPYRDYIDTFVVDPVARTVKRADLMHNLDETRFEGCGRIDEVELSRRRERYRDALGMLDEGERSTSFLSLTLPQGSLRARLRQRCLQRIGARCNAIWTCRFLSTILVRSNSVHMLNFKGRTIWQRLLWKSPAGWI